MTAQRSEPAGGRQGLHRPERPHGAEQGSVVKPTLSRHSSIAQSALHYAGLTGTLYATLEFALDDLEAALAGIPESQKLLRRRLMLRISATKEVLGRTRPQPDVEPVGKVAGVSTSVGAAS